MTNCNNPRFKSDVKRCPNTPYMIFENKEHFHTFKHSELENRKVLDTIVDLLNSLDDEIVLSQSDNKSEYNITRLKRIKEKHKELIQKEYRKNSDLRLENKKLVEENQKLKKENEKLKTMLIREIMDG